MAGETRPLCSPPPHGARLHHSAPPLRSSSPATSTPFLEQQRSGEIHEEQRAAGEVLWDPDAAGELLGVPHVAGEALRSRNRFGASFGGRRAARRLQAVLKKQWSIDSVAGAGEQSSTMSVVHAVLPVLL